MSGYKHTGMSQAYYQAFLAWKTYHEAAGQPVDEDDWDELPDKTAWLAVAEAVRDDTRSEPRW